MINQKIIIYQLFARHFSNTNTNNKFSGSRHENGCGKLNDINLKALESLKRMGITHIWLTGVIRHAKTEAYPEFGIEGDFPGIVKGKAGSPYAIKDYYDIDPDLACNVKGRMKEFEELVERIKSCGLKTIIDFVPNHVSRSYRSTARPAHVSDLGDKDNSSYGFLPDNNFYYLPGQKLKLPGQEQGLFSEDPAKATGNDVFSPAPGENDWYETIKLNYGIDPASGSKHFNPVPDTWTKMLDILLFWASKGIDGFRCDMAGMVPVEFWNFATHSVKEKNSNIIFIAELYEPAKYREYTDIGGFDYLYDKVGLYDAIREIITSNKSTGIISSVWQSLGGLDDKMLRFMENHDEQRIASSHFAGDPWAGLPATALSAFMNKGPVMIYNGQELGEDASGANGFSGDDGRTSIFDYCSVPTLSKWCNALEFNDELLDNKQKTLKANYQEILNCASGHEEMHGHFYDLMWQNQDLPDWIKNKIFAFLRYNSDSTMLIVISFSKELKNCNIRIPRHALELTELDNKQNYSISYLNPESAQITLILNQLTGRGIPVSFNDSGWAAVRIS